MEAIPGAVKIPRRMRLPDQKGGMLGVERVRRSGSWTILGQNFCCQRRSGTQAKKITDTRFARARNRLPRFGYSRRHGSALRFEPRLELGIKLVKTYFYFSGDTGPTVILERGDDDAQLKFEGVVGLKVPPTVATDNFELAIHRLDRVGRGQGTTQGIGILEEGEIVVAFLT